MWKIIISVACLVAATAGTASIDEFLGEWIPLAVNLDDKDPDPPVCVRLLFTKNSANLQCTDDRKFEFVNSSPSNETTLVVPLGIMVVDDVSIVTPTLRVTCTSEGTKAEVLLIVKSINKDYMLAYRLDSRLEKDNPNSAFIYGRKIPTRSELTTIANDIDQLRGKPLTVFCTSD